MFGGCRGGGAVEGEDAGDVGAGGGEGDAEEEFVGGVDAGGPFADAGGAGVVVGEGEGDGVGAVGEFVEALAEVPGGDGGVEGEVEELVFGGDRVASAFGPVAGGVGHDLEHADFAGGAAGAGVHAAFLDGDGAEETPVDAVVPGGVDEGAVGLVGVAEGEGADEEGEAEEGGAEEVFGFHGAADFVSESFRHGG